MKKITYCIPSKNNLRYLKSSIASIRKNSKIDFEIIVFVDSDNDGTEDWLKKKEVRYLKNIEQEAKGIAYAYNRCIEAADTEIVCMFHADMYMAEGFDVNAIKHLKPKVVVSATRIEPPLHPEGKEKIVRNFGLYPEDFLEQEFNSFVKQQKEENLDKVTFGIFAPWMCYKSEIMEIGLHDETFHSYHEDSDIFNRMIISGMKCIQSRDSFVYHLTCRGGQFQDGVEKVTSDQKFHAMKNAAMKNYLRKWGTWIKNDEYQHPIIKSKYDVAFVIKNCTPQLLHQMEPWGTCTYVENPELVESYVAEFQKETKLDLSTRVKHASAMGSHAVVVEFDGNEFSQEAWLAVNQLPDILDQIDESGLYGYSCFRIQVNKVGPEKIELPFVTVNNVF